jgi:hypothetical protein
MRIAVLICCILALAMLALIGLSYTPGISLEVSVTDIDNGVIIQNVGDVVSTVFVSSPEGEQRFELAVGRNVTVIDISQPINVSAVGANISREDWEREKKIMVGWPGITYNLSSNFTELANGIMLIN